MFKIICERFESRGILSVWMSLNGTHFVTRIEDNFGARILDKNCMI